MTGANRVKTVGAYSKVRKTQKERFNGAREKNFGPSPLSLLFSPDPF